MAILAQVRTSATFEPTTAAASPELRANIVDTPLGNATLTADFDQSAILAQPPLQSVDPLTLEPIASAVVDYPAIFPRWYRAGVEGTAVGDFVVGPIVVGVDLDACSRTLEITVDADQGSRRTGDLQSRPIGYEVERGDPPPGFLATHDLDLQLYGRLGTGIAGESTTYRIFAGGWSEDSPRVADGEAHLLTMAANAELLYRDNEVTLTHPAGHGLTHGQLVIEAMQKGGIPDELIGIDPELGAPRTLRVDEACVTLWDLIKRILRPIGYTIMRNKATGVFEAVTLDVDEVPVTTIGIHGDVSDVVGIRPGVSIDADAGLPRCVVAQGFRADPAALGPGSGSVTTEIVVSTFGERAARVPKAAQAALSLTIIPTGNVDPPAQPNVLLQRVTVQTTLTDGCPDLVYTRIEEWTNPPSTRYVASGTPDGLPLLGPSFSVFFFDDIPVSGDATEGYAWDEFRFIITREIWKRTLLNVEKRVVGTVTDTAEFYNPRRRIKSRANASIPWEGQPYATGVNLTANGEGRQFTRARYWAGPTPPGSIFVVGSSALYPSHGDIVRSFRQVVTEEFTINACDETTREVTTTRALQVRDGQTQLYADSSTGASDSEIGLDARETTDYVKEGGGVTEIESSVDFQGKPGNTVVTEAAKTGRVELPRAEICDENRLLSDNEQDFTTEACTTVRLPDGTLVEDRRKKLTLSSRYVETPEEAESWAQRELRILLSWPVSLELVSPMPFLDAGKTVTLNLPELGFPNVPAKIVAHETTMSEAGDPPAERLELRVPRF